MKESLGNAQDWSDPVGKEGNHSQKKPRRKEGEVVLNPIPLTRASVINCALLPGSRETKVISCL